MTNLKGIHHIVLKVKNPKKSAEFYSKVCGLEIFSHEEDAYGLTGGGLDSLCLVTPENTSDAKLFNRRGDIGLDHWAWTVTSMDNLKAIESHLRELNIDMEDGGITDDGYGGTAIFTQDPDGIPLEFHLVSE